METWHVGVNTYYSSSTCISRTANKGHFLDIKEPGVGTQREGNRLCTPVRLDNSTRLHRVKKKAGDGMPDKTKSKATVCDTSEGEAFLENCRLPPDIAAFLSHNVVNPAHSVYLSLTRFEKSGMSLFRCLIHPQKSTATLKSADIFTAN
jgi:hypothetical protein